MSYIRKNILNILLFILWIGMAASVTTAHADGDGAGAVRKDYLTNLALTTRREVGPPAVNVGTHAGLPGDFGHNVHTSLFVPLPQRVSLPAGS